MSITRIERFKCSDGSEFDTKEEAKVCENRVHAAGELKRLLVGGCEPSPAAKGMIDQVLDEAQMVAEILKNYVRRLPKQEFVTTPMLARAA